MARPELNFSIRRVGDAARPSPLQLSKRLDDFQANYVTDEQRVIYDVETEVDSAVADVNGRATLEKAGPRELIYWDPATVRAAVLTAGGLCPGLNDVIRSVVMTLWYRYGVRDILGIRYGYRGLVEMDRHEPLRLEPSVVRDIYHEGGTILGSSRGDGDRFSAMAQVMVARGINVLFTVGGDGTQKGARVLCRELAGLGATVSVVGIPKTIDNDLCFVERSFGFETAVAEAVRAVASAHIEARGALDGIGLVKVMGRESGFIAATTALAQNDVNFVLIPEVPFELGGDKGFLAQLERRLDTRGHAVILVAEGAGQSLLSVASETDASGNQRLGDIGLFLKNEVTRHFAAKSRAISLKYIDPSYLIRSVPAVPSDSVYCARLGANAVHAAMSGRTECLVGLVNNRYVHVPMEVAVGQRNRVDPEGPLWRDVVEATGQPPLMCNI